MNNFWFAISLSPPNALLLPLQSKHDHRYVVFVLELALLNFSVALTIYFKLFRTVIIQII